MSSQPPKRPGGPLPEQPTKMAKTTTAASKVPELKPVMDITTVPVRNIDQHITTESTTSGICSIEALKHIESQYAVRFTMPFVEYQHRLLVAQAHVSDQLAQHAVQHQNTWGTLKPKPNEAIHLAKKLLIFAQKDSIKACPDLRAALYYRVTFIMSYGSFYATPDIVTNKYKELAELLDMPVTHLYEELTSASENHLARSADPSCLWQTVPLTVSSSTLSVPASSSSVYQLSSGDSGLTDIASDAWLDTQVKRLVKPWQEMVVDESFVPIDEFDRISTKDKMVLKTARRLRRGRGGDK